LPTSNAMASVLSGLPRMVGNSASHGWPPRSRIQTRKTVV
jgi:hypothetical protein